MIISFNLCKNPVKEEMLFPLKGGENLKGEKLGDRPEVIFLVSGKARPGTQFL